MSESNIKNILVVEDNDQSFELIKIVFKKEPYNFYRAVTGKNGVKMALNGYNIDLVLMDIRLPEMDGYEATKKIRESNQQIPIIATTSYGLTGDREKSLQAGCNDYMSKPINFIKLKEMLQKYL